jgi:heat shock protein 4
LESTQEWLYGEGEDVTKSVYASKLNELKALGDPIAKRYYEYEHRFDEVSHLKNTINQLKLNATSMDPKYDHISAEDKVKVVSECETLEKWLNEKMQAQEKLSKHVNPVFTVAEVHKKNEDITRLANSLLNKPKPAPKKEEPKKEEAPKPEEKKEEAKPEEKKEEPKAEQPAKEMDLD